MNQIKIVIGSDHAGYYLKNELIDFLSNNEEIANMVITDVGCNSFEPVDYPDYAKKVCKEVLDDYDFGILICGTGIGMAIVANRFKGIRCAVATNEYCARMSRLHNNANVLALGGRVLGVELAKAIVALFLTTPFLGDKHQQRLEKIEDFS